MAEKQTAEELLAKIKKGEEVEVSESTGSQYEHVICTIKAVNVDYPAKLLSDHPLVHKMNDDQLAIQFLLSVKFDDGRIFDKEEVGGFQTKKGGIAFYAGSEDGSLTPSLLWEIVDALKKYNAKQASLFEKLNFKEEMFKGLSFEFEGKVNKKDGEEFVILATAYQRKKDKEFAESQANKNDVGGFGEEDDEEESTPMP